MRIYVGNLAPETTEAELQRLFSRFGEVTATVLARTEPSGQAQEFGYVDMPVEAHAWNAIRKLDGQGLQVRGWTITVVEFEDAE